MFGKRPVLLCVLLMLAGLILPQPQAALAAPTVVEGVTITDLSQVDEDRDGILDHTIILCSFATEDDRVDVYDGVGDMAASDDWQQATDFDDDTWVFDVGNDGSAQLVIQFSRSGEFYRAMFFPDVGGDGTVSLHTSGIDVSVTESEHSPLIVEALGGWFLPDGQLNWNVRFQTDGPSVSQVHTMDWTARFNQLLKFDGEPESELEFTDKDQDGVPESGVFRTTPRADITGTVLWANAGLHRPAQPEGYLFWPYLNPITAAQNYFDAPPALRVDWASGRVSQVSFSGYPIEQGYHVNTLESFEAGVLNYANFENAQAYYDLAGDQDSSPELHIRHRYYAAGDPYGWGLDSPVNEIRWSWAQASDGSLVWDYKLGLAGRHAITSEASLGEYRYLTVPYQDLPDWVMAQPWDYATFVCREDANYRSSEGIYTWAPVETPLGDDVTALSRYLAGQIAVDVGQAFQSVSVGWRAELAPELGAQPYIYFSPLDRRLHLRRAEYGIWQIDDTSLVHLADQDGDGYLDQWQYLEDGQVRRQLNWTPDYLVYAGDGRVVLTQASAAPSLFETLPPRDHEEWLELGRQLETHRHDLAPGDLEAMAAQFEGPVTRIEGAALRDFRPDDNGFRFVLSLPAGYRVAGTDLLGLDGLPPGEYVVEHRSGAFMVTPLLPAQLSLEVRQIAGDGVTAALQATIRNSGLADAPGLLLVAEASGSDGDLVELARRPVDALAGQTLQVLVDVPSTLPAGTALYTRLEDGDCQVQAVGTPLALARSDTDPTHAILGVLRVPLLLPAVGLFAALLAAATWLVMDRQRGRLPS